MEHGGTLRLRCVYGSLGASGVVATELNPLRGLLRLFPWLVRRRAGGLILAVGAGADPAQTFARGV